MKTYANITGKSSVKSYEIMGSEIIIRFQNLISYGSYPNIGYANTYRYTYVSAGQANVEMMKSLANQGYGLNTYINSIQPQYANRWEKQ